MVQRFSRSISGAVDLAGAWVVGLAVNPLTELVPDKVVRKEDEQEPGMLGLIRNAIEIGR